MVERLVAIHDDLGVHMDSGRAEAEYADAFRDYGVDVEKLGAREAGARLAASPVAVELAGALDQWIFIRRERPTPRRNSPEDDGVRQLLAVAKAADPDPWRNRLRDALGRRSKQGPATRGRRCDGSPPTADPENLPEASVTRLAFALSGVEDVETADLAAARAHASTRTTSGSTPTSRGS